jgi:uncharacterized membrane protein
MVLVGGTLTLAGIVIVVIGVREAADAGCAGAVDIATRGLATVFAGAVLFSVGAMLALVGIVRPLFGHRPVDKHGEK